VKNLKNVSIIVILFILLLSNIVKGQNQYYNGQLIVKMSPTNLEINPSLDDNGNVITGLPFINQLNISNNCQKITKLYRGPNPDARGLYIFKFNQNADLENLSKIYAQLACIEAVEPDRLISVGQTYPDDPAIGQENGLEQMDAPEAWEIETGNSNAIISINDTGVD